MSPKGLVLEMLVRFLQQNLTSELMNELADDILDKVEYKIASTPTLVDDVTIGNMIKVFRAAFNIPDGDD